MRRTLQRRRTRGLLTKNIFTEKEWTDINRLVDDMDGFYGNISKRTTQV